MASPSSTSEGVKAWMLESPTKNEESRSEDGKDIADEDRGTEYRLDTILESLGGEFRERLADTSHKALVNELDDIFKAYSEHGSRRHLLQSLSHFLRRDTHEVLEDPSSVASRPTLRIVDQDLTYLLSDNLDLSRKFTFDKRTLLDPDIMVSMNQMFRLGEMEMQVLFSHYCRLHGPEPIFRVGLSALFSSRYNSALEPYFRGFSSRESQRLVLQTFEDRPGQLNELELTYLQRVARMSPDAIDEQWGYLNEIRHPWALMRLVLMANEVRRIKNTLATGGDPS